MVPVHTWLPDAATEATPATAVLLVGVLDKVGTFGMIRFCLQLFPEASAVGHARRHRARGHLGPLRRAARHRLRRDIMRLIAYTSISHFGFIVLGIFALTSTAGAGLGALHGQPRVLDGRRCSSSPACSSPAAARQRIADYGGWQRVTPVLAGDVPRRRAVGLALPGLSSFVSEFLVLAGTFQR